MEKYIGKTIEIIYLGSDGQITQRQIEVRSVANGIVRARCLQRNAREFLRWKISWPCIWQRGGHHEAKQADTRR